MFQFFHRIKLSLAFVMLISSFITTQAAFSCSRVLLVDKNNAVMVGRNMDWFEDMKTNLWVFPQGMQRDGAAVVNSLQWQSKYGSIVANGYDLVATDGINEKGFAAHVLALSESDYGPRDAKKPGMSILFWAQYYLDNFQSVDEAVRFTETNSFQIEPYYEPKSNKWVNLHLALEDASGDSAIIEYINGSPRVYHGRDYTVLTNSPTYDLQLANLKQYGGFGGDKPLPGTTSAPDRFVRAAYYLNHLPPTISTRDEISKVLGVVSNVAEPYGTSSPERPSAIPTIWTVVADLTNKVYYFHSITSMNMVSAQMNKFDLRSGAPVMKLDLVNNPDLAGDVTKDFQPVN